MQPKANGGLGFGLLKDMKASLLSKWWWRYKQEDSGLWKEVISATHDNPRCHHSIPVKNYLSGVWVDIHKSVNSLIAVGVKVDHLIHGSVKSGADIKFWLDPWAVNQPLKDKFPLLYKPESNKRVVMNERFMCLNASLGLNWDWLRDSLLQSELGELNRCFSLLSSVSLSDGTDSWIWRGDSSGSFSTSSIRKLLSPRSPTNDAFEWNR